MNLSERLSTVSRELNGASDDLSRALSELEKSVNVLNLGVQAEVTAGRDAYFGFGHEHGKWCFYYRMGVATTPTPILQASRELRLQFVGQVVSLLHELYIESARVLGMTSTATATLEAFNRAIKGDEPLPMGVLNWQVVVGNTKHLNSYVVYSGPDAVRASDAYDSSVKSSKGDDPLFSGRPVTLLCDGQVREEYNPK
jgi:hypothetical protein